MQKCKNYNILNLFCKIFFNKPPKRFFSIPVLLSHFTAVTNLYITYFICYCIKCTSNINFPSSTGIWTLQFIDKTARYSTTSESIFSSDVDKNFFFYPYLVQLKPIISQHFNYANRVNFFRNFFFVYWISRNPQVGEKFFLVRASSSSCSCN